jgi:hypothetical protein
METAKEFLPYVADRKPSSRAKPAPVALSPPIIRRLKANWIQATTRITL